MEHAHEMGPDASTKVTLNLDAISENVLAEVMDVFAFKFLWEVGVDINALQFSLLQAYGVCVFVCVCVCVCVGVYVCGCGNVCVVGCGCVCVGGRGDVGNVCFNLRGSSIPSRGTML